MKVLDYLAKAAQLVLDGNENGAAEVFETMPADLRLKFDGLLLKTDDPLARQGGPPVSRFKAKVQRMAELRAGFCKGSE